MEKSLVIVESPAKARTIGKYLGPGFEVIASVGHIIDLPSKSMGVDLDSGNFTPTYEPIIGKNKVISDIKKHAKKADIVFLAPDPDREGEAIAFHIESIIKEACAKSMPEVYRVRFHELTKKAIKEAFLKPDKLNQALFYAQQARRILDRVVGYQISPVLWKKVQRGLSAGRVQSVAVRLVVDREKEIEKFKSEEYWSLEALIKASKEPNFLAKLFKIDDKKAQISNENDAFLIKEKLQNQKGKVSKVQKKERTRRPGPPFITSKLQQDAARAFRFSSKQTMRIAQSLYEGVELGELGVQGLITYMRTDSTRVSDDALKEVRDYILENFGKENLPEKPNFYKNKKSAQEAHEAIRPTSINLTPQKIKPFLSIEQYKLYELIYNRFLASQMMPAVYDQTTIDIACNIYILRAVGSILKFKGFLSAYEEQMDEDDEGAKEEALEEKTRLPDIMEGEEVFLKDVKADQHFTQAPPRFTEASLVKELEEKGIGRPSTYASIMTTIVEKGYTEKKEGRFFPTELGRVVTELLIENFPDILDVTFTALMEDNLDKIEEGKEDWLKIMNDFYSPFKISLEKASLNMRNLKRMEEKTDILCPKCKNSNLVVKWGKSGSFLGCLGYPDCSFTTPFERQEGKIIVKEQKSISNVKCPSCASDMAIKRSRFGEFLGCVRYPDCSATMPIPLGVKCPKDGCSGDIAQRKSKRGKDFYGCTNYPKCDFASWQKPVNTPCACGSNYQLEKVTKDGVSLVCPSCKGVSSV